MTAYPCRGREYESQMAADIDRQPGDVEKYRCIEGHWHWRPGPSLGCDTVSEPGRVWVVTWELPFEDGGFSSVWTTEEAARAEADRRRASDGIGAQWSVREVQVDQSLDGMYADDVLPRPSRRGVTQ